MYSPLEQFEFFIFGSQFFPSVLIFSFFNMAIFYFSLFFCFLFLIRKVAATWLVYDVQAIFFQYFYEITLFCYHILNNAIRNQYFLRQYFVFYCLSFVFILSSNLIGLLPFAFTLTSQIILTFGLSFFFFFGVNFMAVQRHGINYLSLFLPAGSPFYLSFLLVPIEILSYVARVFSLSIRLFANMMSGHCLLKILAGFAWTMLVAGGLLSAFFVLPLIVVILVTALEFIVAFLQAYVYCLLLSIYIRDCVHLH